MTPANQGDACPTCPKLITEWDDGLKAGWAFGLTAEGELYRRQRGRRPHWEFVCVVPALTDCHVEVAALVGALELAWQALPDSKTEALSVVRTTLANRSEAAREHAQAHDDMGRALAEERRLTSGQAEDIAHAYLMLRELLGACSCEAHRKVLEKYGEARAALAGKEPE